METVIKDLGKILVDTYLNNNGFPGEISKKTAGMVLHNGLNDIVQQQHLNPDRRKIRGIISESIVEALMSAGYSDDQQAKMYRRYSSENTNCGNSI